MIRKSFLVFSILLATASLSFAADEMRLVGFCSSCHGTDGSGPGENLPMIGGQNEEYLVSSMEEVRDKKRYATMMHVIAKGYTKEEIAIIAKSFAQKDWKSSDKPFDKALAKKGKALSATCNDCHGVDGVGAGQTPRIAGQHAKYLYYSLLEYKNKVRNNEGVASEMDVVIGMSDEDLRALAEYFSSLR